MSRRSKGPRLYLRKGRLDSRSGQRLPDIYFIRDGQKERSTGCGPEGIADAERQLADYIAEKWSPEATTDTGQRSGDPASIFIAEVAALYLLEKAPRAPDPSGVKARFKALLDFWGEMTLADVKRSTCEAYVAERITHPIASAKDPTTARRVSAQGARRELEDLSSAIGYWAGEHPLDRRPKVTLPEKPESPRDALTRSQAAALLLAALGWHRDAKGMPKRRGLSARANRGHLRRFVLIGLYTGTRPGVVPKLLWEESPTSAWVDLDDGVIYRRGRDEREHKTKKRTLVRIPDRLLAHLRRWRDMDKIEMARREREGLPTCNNVLHHGGQPITSKIRRGYAACVADAGLSDDVTPHWHRHTAATWLMERDAKPWDAAGFLGMTMKTLEDNYGHHRPGHQSSALKAMGRKS
ncbi:MULTISPECIES: tyrosine-type recombinase/integrase [Brevundimonas]|uniref:tyrosine-type recombinase/integrase n=1 Tax=Brevundimonas sp. UBA7507 TaxID=1946137 RepID=UPI00257EDAC3|nr:MULTISPECIES: tyrosine-type recombinase/integrase [Brevundimonas]